MLIVNSDSTVEISLMELYLDKLYIGTLYSVHCTAIYWNMFSHQPTFLLVFKRDINDT